MPKIDLTISISVLLAISALISPVITTVMNNRYQFNLKKLEYEQRLMESTLFYKRGIYEKYLSCTGKFIAHGTSENKQEYGEIYALALIYFPENLVPDIQNLNTAIDDLSLEEATTLLNRLAPKIRILLENM